MKTLTMEQIVALAVAPPARCELPEMTRDVWTGRSDFRRRAKRQHREVRRDKRANSWLESGLRRD